MTLPSNYIGDLLALVRQRLFNERLAHALSKAAAERQFAFDLASVIDEFDPTRVALPECAGNARGGVGNVDLLVIPSETATQGYRLQPPANFPPGTIAIEMKEIRLTRSNKGKYGYYSVLKDVRDQVTNNPGKLVKKGGQDADWFGLVLMSDGMWRGCRKNIRRQIEKTARDVRIDKWEPGPPNLVCIGSVSGSLEYRDWSGNVWVEVFQLMPSDEKKPKRDDIFVRPPDSTSGGNEQDTLWRYATHGADGCQLDGYRHGPAHLGVNTAVLHSYRRAQFDHAGRWPGTFEELRLCLFMEQRIWAHNGGDHFERQPAVEQLVGELRAAWGRENLR